MPHGADLVVDLAVRQRMTEEAELQARNIIKISVAQLKKTVERKNLKGLDLDLEVEGIHVPGPEGGLVQGLGLVQDLMKEGGGPDLGIIIGEDQDLDLVVELPRMVPDFM